MFAVRLHSIHRSCLLALFLYLVTAPAFADSITIGTATYIGLGTWSNPSKIWLILQLDTRGLMFDSHAPSLPYALGFDVDVYGSMGKIVTSPPTSMVINAPRYCPCETISFTMSLSPTGPLRLANGQLFNPARR